MGEEWPGGLNLMRRRFALLAKFKAGDSSIATRSSRVSSCENKIMYNFCISVDLSGKMIIFTFWATFLYAFSLFFFSFYFYPYFLSKAVRAYDPNIISFLLSVCPGDRHAAV